MKISWKHPEESLKFLTFSTFSLCPLWVCPLHPSKHRTPLVHPSCMTSPTLVYRLPDSHWEELLDGQDFALCSMREDQELPCKHHAHDCFGNDSCQWLILLPLRRLITSFLITASGMIILLVLRSTIPTEKDTCAFFCFETWFTNSIHIHIHEQFWASSIWNSIHIARASRWNSPVTDTNTHWGFYEFPFFAGLTMVL